MKTIEQLAIEINRGLNRDAEAVEFAQLLIAAWKENQEPVAYRKLLKFEDGTEEYKYMSFKIMKDAEPLYLAPPPAVPDGYVLVPKEILDSFPEINPSNYGHGDVCTLNAWGVELVLATQGQSPLQGEQK